MLPFLKSARNFVCKNRGKIIISSVVAVAVTAYFLYNTDETEEQKESITDRNNHILLKNNYRKSSRSKLLLKVRRQFDASLSQFLPLLRSKVIDIVDINGTVRQIKELRTKPSISSAEKEKELWEEIKIASLSMIFVSIYILCATCTLLKIQLFVMARQMFIQIETKSNFLNPDDREMHFNAELFRGVIDGTYSHLFGNGLIEFTKLVKDEVSEVFQEWKVKEKLEVSYDELVEKFSKIRLNIETEFNLKSIFLATDETILTSSSHEKNESKTNTDELSVQQLLSQTWDILESPLFLTVYLEAVDVGFKLVFEQLRNSVFLPSNPVQSHILRSPPLASVLPQLKTTATQLLRLATKDQDTTNIEENASEKSSGDSPFSLTSEIKEISSVPHLEAFCMSVFDAAS